MDNKDKYFLGKLLINGCINDFVLIEAKDYSEAEVKLHKYVNDELIYRYKSVDYTLTNTL